MIVHSFGAHQIMRTVALLERSTAVWLSRINEVPGFAFGDDPTPVFELEDALQEMSSRIERLQHVLDAQDVAFDVLLAYRTAREHIRRVYEFVVDVRIEDRGSTALTRSLVEMLTECLGHLAQLRTHYDNVVAPKHQVSTRS